jgi:hypothetical protein
LRRADLDRAARAYTEHGEPVQTGGLYVVEEEEGSGNGSGSTDGGGDGGDGGGGGGVGACKRSRPRRTAPTEEAARDGGGGSGGGGGVHKRARPSGRTAMAALLPAEGDALQVRWDENGKWYLATVVAHNTKTGVHTLRYRDGDETEEVDLSAAAAEKVTWCKVAAQQRGQA